MYQSLPESAGEVNKPLLIAKMVILTILLVSGIVEWIMFTQASYLNVVAAAQAVGSCFMLGLLSTIYLHFNITVFKGTLEQRFNRTRLKIIFILTIVVGVIQFMGAISYIVIATTQKQKFQLEGPSYYLASIPAALAALVAPFLAYETKAAMALFPEGNTGVATFPSA